VHPHFIHEHQPPRVDRRGNHHPPNDSQELVALRGASSPFLWVEPIRAMERHMVERLTEIPLMASTYTRSARRG
jgi:hypothetical protein